MTPLTQALLQEVKDEVLKKYSKEFWTDLHGNVLLLATEDVCQLYHTRLLAEAGKGLNVHRGADGERVVYFVEATALLAAKQAEIDRLNKEVVSFQMMAQSAFKVGLDALTEEATKRMESDSMFSMVVAKLSYQVKENESLKSQLEAAQKEIDGLRSVLKECYGMLLTHDCPTDHLIEKVKSKLKPQ